MKTAARRSLVPLVLALVLLALPAAAEVYTITLHSGNTFLSKYRPIDAPFDSEYLLFMTDVGNVISLPKADVADITTETETQGFGIVIDTTTVLIGYSANDLPTEEQALEVWRAGTQRPNFGPAIINTQQFTEPSVVGGEASSGVPLGYAQGFSTTYVVNQ